MAKVEVSQCGGCGRKAGDHHRATMKLPSISTLERWADNGGAKATDGCSVEPDGICEHGHKSWLIEVGVI